MNRTEMKGELVRIKEAIDMLTMALEMEYDPKMVAQLNKLIEEHNDILDILGAN